jgi:hypothetical protein
VQGISSVVELERTSYGGFKVQLSALVYVADYCTETKEGSGIWQCTIETAIDSEVKMRNTITSTSHQHHMIFAKVNRWLQLRCLMSLYLCDCLYDRMGPHL